MLRHIVAAVAALTIAMAAGSAAADDKIKYRVTITNLTKGQSFTPQLVVTHRGDVSMFRLGETASPGVGRMAEGGDTSVLLDELLAYPSAVGDYAVAEGAAGLLAPGETTSVVVTAGRRHRYLSLAGMLLPTNDTFVALNRVRLPRHGVTELALAYDAGTEPNDQSCAHIPGPQCGGEPFSAPSDMDEGFVHVSNGIHELPRTGADSVIGPHEYDWRNPVARIVVRRLYY